MVTSPGCVCTITSSQLAIGRRPAVAADRLFTPASLKWYRSWISLTKSNIRQCVLASLCGILYHLVSTSLTSASSCRSSYKRGCDECSIQWTHDRKHVLILWITREPYLQCGDDHQSPSVNNTPLSFTWVYILNMTWSAIYVKPLLFTCIGLGSQSASSPWAIPPRRASKRGEPLRASPEGLPTMAREDITAALVWPSSPQPSSGCTWIERSGVLEILFLD